MVVRYLDWRVEVDEAGFVATGLDPLVPDGEETAGDAGSRV